MTVLPCWHTLIVSVPVAAVFSSIISAGVSITPAARTCLSRTVLSQLSLLVLGLKAALPERSTESVSINIAALLRSLITEKFTIVNITSAALKYIG